MTLMQIVTCRNSGQAPLAMDRTVAIGATSGTFSALLLRLISEFAGQSPVP